MTLTQHSAILLSIFLFTVCVNANPVPEDGSDCIVLLHGLARTNGSMEALAETFRSEGYRVANVNYPSRDHTIVELSEIAVNDGIGQCADTSAMHFVTHSLGGILVRQYLANNTLDQLGRVVMIAPPNQGSEVVDNWQRVPGFKLWNGPAGMQLGTGANSVPRSLGKVSFELGVIAGTKSMNPLLSQSLPNPDDGKVSVASTKVVGMSDHITVERTHTFIMQADEVIRQALQFIRSGNFEHSS